ncbi:PREDICTED: keratin-associated protein 10-4-like [Corvus brachyrhynchos]|uniref:keratin-associated protein 10-4-like n=1 Tax=Corvus brachyrhynchos TaxID=85066 RepID=UPI0008164C8B|nr:PREDICTED: keratin-associated protein 10-4-like [Corvus brachyrhynchos]
MHIPGSTMSPGVFLLLGLLILRAEPSVTPEKGGDTQKPGRCPRDFMRCLRLESPLCANDSSCPAELKCCPWECRLRCIPPAEGTAPRYSRDTSPAPATQRPLLHQWGCLQDQDCPPSHVCCHQLCSRHCVAKSAGKDGFCPVRAGLFPSYDCRAQCWHDGECPREEKCCLSGCDYVCLPPSREKPGICPLAEEAPLAVTPCGTTCTKDWQCPGAEKCCSSSRCGHVCSAPEPDKPSECPKVRPQRTSEPCTEMDSCTHDRDCSRQEKCCFSGCAMRCTRPAREHPGECPRAEPCWDPRRRGGSQCLDDSVCGREEKCCDTGCGWECVAVPRDSGDRADGRCVEECQADSQCPRGQRCTSIGCGHVCMDIPGEHDTVAVPWHGAERCSEECEADSQCPWGQRCTRTSCGRVCVDTPGGEAQETQVLPQETWGVPAGWPAAGCSALQAEVERAPCLGVVGPAWTGAASMRSVPRAISAAATAAATSARGCLVIRRPMATVMGQYLH